MQLDALFQHPHALPAAPKIVDELVRNDPAWVDARYVDSMFVARKAMA